MKRKTDILREVCEEEGGKVKDAEELQPIKKSWTRDPAEIKPTGKGLWEFKTKKEMSLNKERKARVTI